MNTNTMTNNELLAAAENYRKSMLEGGDGYNPFEAEYIQRTQDALNDATTKFAAEWTREVTAERREAWNAAAKRNVQKAGKAKMTADQMKALIAATESEVGFSYRQLKEAIRNHGM